MNISTRWIEVPECVQPYHVEPMIIAASVLLGLALIIAVTILIAMRMDGGQK